MKKYLLWFSLIINVFVVIFGLLLIYDKSVLSNLKAKITSAKTVEGYSDFYLGKMSIFESGESHSNKVVFLGDSLTDYGEWNEYFITNDILNRGISGDTTDGVLHRLKQVYNIQPSKVFIMVGINDLRKDVDIDTILINFSTILNELKLNSPNTAIFVQSVLPMNSQLRKNSVKSKNVLELNSRLKKLTADTKVSYIDLFSLMSNKENQLKPEFTFDGLHLNGIGYHQWVNGIKKLVED
ncbi:GDSL-type esterase/lipase family protein [Lederbergia wuyishanensis]|uniref:Lysophospholipase L1-like esterase n=1 Tax=Lederbergia wuyishanensis TaxID=1347903 RepID=A0ABU0D374_9BACI|nr:GDSL-type esterase/lipase family protein [Lederbergia wuyishanensis]MCJ8008006.1 GDSL-type esterase/lipase family protein [Lederbergia wuyishanensis]MDQ0342823.1 lysophospholipase L1-like esterase [Lederbergia wuyishanensis]